MFKRYPILIWPLGFEAAAKQERERTAGQIRLGMSEAPRPGTRQVLPSTNHVHLKHTQIEVSESKKQCSFTCKNTWGAKYIIGSEPGKVTQASS